jgi:hypothetical protein
MEFKNQASLFPADALPDDGESFVDSSRLGRYAEFMVCAELTKLGYHALHVDAPGFDIIASCNEASVRVQVKSTSRVAQPPPPHAGRGRPPRSGEYCEWNCKTHEGATNGKKMLRRGQRTLDRRDADVLALYHHRFNTITFLPITALNGSGKVILPLAQVKQNHSKQSLEYALKSIGIIGGGQ